MKTSTFFSLNGKDLLKGLWMAVLAAVAAIIIPVIANINSTWTFDWTLVWHSAASAAGLYLFKNLLTDSSDNFLKIGSSKPPVIDSSVVNP